MKKHQDHSPLGAPFTTFTNAPPRKEARRIHKGKYIAFDKLLPPLDDQLLPALIGKGKIDKTQRLVSDLPSWLEAWNTFVAIRVQTFPDTALAMLQYQSTICLLFSGCCPEVRQALQTGSGTDQTPVPTLGQPERGPASMVCD